MKGKAQRSREGVQLLDPKNDFVFKRVFSEAPELLIELINAIRTDEPVITELKVVNPQIDPEELTGKYIIMDLQAIDESGTRYNIEMQVRRYNAWSSRSAFYMARLLSQQLNPGDDYATLKPAIGIHLLDFDLFQEPEHQKQAIWHFEMRDCHQPEVRLGKELQLNLIEMRKADKLNLSSGALNAWITFFEHWQEELTMADIAYQPVKDALQRVKDLSADEEAQRMAFVRERALYEEASLLKDATDNGIEIGERKGQIELLTRLLNRRFGELPGWVSDKLDSAEAEQIAQWSENILFASTLETVFEPVSDS